MWVGFAAYLACWRRARARPAGRVGGDRGAGRRLRAGSRRCSPTTSTATSTTPGSAPCTASTPTSAAPPRPPPTPPSPTSPGPTRRAPTGRCSPWRPTRSPGCRSRPRSLALKLVAGGFGARDRRDLRPARAAARRRPPPRRRLRRPQPAGPRPRRRGRPQRRPGDAARDARRRRRPARGGGLGGRGAGRGAGGQGLDRRRRPLRPAGRRPRPEHSRRWAGLIRAGRPVGGSCSARRSPWRRRWRSPTWPSAGTGCTRSGSPERTSRRRATSASRPPPPASPASARRRRGSARSPSTPRWSPTCSPGPGAAATGSAPPPGPPLGLLLATSWLLPWYLIWALPLAALSRDRTLQLLVLALTAFQLGARLHS